MPLSAGELSHAEERVPGALYLELSVSLGCSQMIIDLIAKDRLASLIPSLGAILHDCVSGGASVGFMNPFSETDALAFFDGVRHAVEAGKTLLFGAFIDGKLVGTVQLGLDGPCNQRHRGDVKKLLVHRDARGRGVGAALMTAIEAEAQRRRLTLLTLDTVAGSDAEPLYRRLGWTKAGVIPNYAKSPDGRLCDVSIFWKAL